LKIIKNIDRHYKVNYNQIKYLSAEIHTGESMKIFNFGSLNIDDVYRVSHIAQPGETLATSGFQNFPGGKGLNQSLAIARAGGIVGHVGLVGQDGLWLRDLLADNGVDTSGIRTVSTPTGRAIIQVETSGQNAIILFGGANRLLTANQIETALSEGNPRDLALTQNETTGVGDILVLAKKRGMMTCFNPAPMGPEVAGYPLDCVDLLILNETEARELAKVDGVLEAGDTLRKRFPATEILLTLGKNGAILYRDGKLHRVNALSVKAIDTTGAGDTFIGYFLAARQAGLPPERCLERAAKAAALSVTKLGAADSIPGIDEVDGWRP
jgi:ribokinase